MASSTKRSSVGPLAILLSVVAVAVAAACGNSGDDAVKTGTGGAGGVLGSGGKSTGGAMTGGVKGTGGMAAMSVPPSVQCMAQTCRGYVLQGTALSPCCVDGNKCGVSFAGQAACALIDAPGVADVRCRAYDGSELFMQAPMGVISFDGCCTAQGFCGAVIDASLIGGPSFGCTDVRGYAPNLQVVSCGPGGAGGMSGAGGATATGGAGVGGNASGGNASGGASGVPTTGGAAGASGAQQGGNAGNSGTSN